MVNSVSFCAPQSYPGEVGGTNPGLLATAKGAKVELWKLQQREKTEDDSEADEIEPIAKITKFKDEVTIVKLREDGQVILVGDKNGLLQLMELKNKVVLRTYENEHKNQINYLDFSCNKRNFVSCSNETSWKLYDIQNSKGSIATCHAAHSDHVKQVQFVPGVENLVISGAQDKEVKMWEINQNGGD